VAIFGLGPKWQDPNGGTQVAGTQVAWDPSGGTQVAGPKWRDPSDPNRRTPLEEYVKTQKIGLNE
jgi:hypothetical protein